MQHLLGFNSLELENRLGQAVQLGVAHIYTETRDYLFITALSQQASSFVGKNAEHFAFQLCERFNLEPWRFELVEFRAADAERPFWRWRFEWVGHSPLSGRCETVTSPTQQALFCKWLGLEIPPRSAMANER